MSTLYRTARAALTVATLSSLPGRAAAQQSPAPSATPGAPAETPAPPPTATAPAAPSTPPAPPPVSSAAPAPAPVAAPPPAPPPLILTLPPPPTDAVLHIASNYEDSVLEGRVRVDGGDYHALCTAPCDRAVRVDGMELRMAAPGMTKSNVFAVEPGPGIARFRVHGGSAALRTGGLVAFLVGLPVSFAGMTFYALSKVNDDEGQRSTGVTTLTVGAIITVAAIPLLLLGGTSVTDARGRDIAKTGSRTPAF